MAPGRGNAQIPAHTQSHAYTHSHTLTLTQIQSQTQIRQFVSSGEYNWKMIGLPSMKMMMTTQWHTVWLLLSFVVVVARCCCPCELLSMTRTCSCILRLLGQSAIERAYVLFIMIMLMSIMMIKLMIIALTFTFNIQYRPIDFWTRHHLAFNILTTSI